MKRAALAPQLVESLCRVNQGPHQCRWLAQDGAGFMCTKHDGTRRGFIVAREHTGSLHAIGDNCHGIYPWIYGDPPSNAPITSSYYDASSMIFVFGSNKAGRHGLGAALHARKYFGAKYGEGDGPTGRAYAIPTKDEDMKVLPLEEITASVERFVEYTHQHPEFTFLVTAIGCGLAGYLPHQIAPLFSELPENCFVSPRFILP